MNFILEGNLVEVKDFDTFGTITISELNKLKDGSNFRKNVTVICKDGELLEEVKKVKLNNKLAVCGSFYIKRVEVDGIDGKIWVDKVSLTAIDIDTDFSINSEKGLVGNKV